MPMVSLSLNTGSVMHRLRARKQYANNTLLSRNGHDLRLIKRDVKGTYSQQESQPDPKQIQYTM